MAAAAAAAAAAKNNAAVHLLGQNKRTARMAETIEVRYEAALQEIQTLKEENGKLQETISLMKQIVSLMKQVEVAKEAALARQRRGRYFLMRENGFVKGGNTTAAQSDRKPSKDTESMAALVLRKGSTGCRI